MSVGFSQVAEHPSAGPWATARGASAIQADALRQFLAYPGRRAPDSLVSETRRHLRGCLETVATMVLQQIARQPDLTALADTLDPALCWHHVQARPDLISVALLDHMRDRAAVALLSRAMKDGDPVADPTVDATVAPPGLLDDGEERVSQAALTLLLAQARWSESMAQDGPMAADLPSEYFAALVWVAAACTMHAIAGVVDTDVAPSMAEAAAAVLARHDEERGAITRADHLAMLLAGRADARGQAARALEDGDILLFAALAARDIGAPIEAVLHALWSGSIDGLAAICHHVGASRAAAARLFDRVGLVRPSDAGPVALMAAIEGMSDADIARQIARLRMPTALTDLLGRLGDPA